MALKTENAEVLAEPLAEARKPRDADKDATIARLTAELEEARAALDQLDEIRTADAKIGDQFAADAAKWKARAEAAEARAGISEPYEPGGFVGDIYYGHPVKTTFGTHRWNGAEWEKLPSEAEVLTELLAEARKQRDAAEALLGAAYRAALEDAANRCDTFRGIDHIAQDMDLGIFPQQSERQEAISRAIRALPVPADLVTRVNSPVTTDITQPIKGD